ncbi:MAG: hypothetical protein ACTHJ4_07470 [Candidatus Nucleicultricaceae bacterium]
MDPSRSKNPVYKVTRLTDRFKPANDNRLPRAIVIKRAIFVIILLALVVIFFKL